MKDGRAIRTAVQCGACGWKGWRVARRCDYDHGEYEHCYCAFRHCPKCGFKVRTAASIRETRKNDAVVAKWWAEHGEAEMARLNAICAPQEGSTP